MGQNETWARVGLETKVKSISIATDPGFLKRGDGICEGQVSAKIHSHVVNTRRNIKLA